MRAEMKQKKLNKVWAVTKGRYRGKAATARITGTRKRRSNDGGPQSSGANLEPVAPRKRKRDEIDLDNSAAVPIVIDNADGNGDIIMTESVSKRVKLEVD